MRIFLLSLILLSSIICNENDPFESSDTLKRWTITISNKLGFGGSFFIPEKDEKFLPSNTSAYAQFKLDLKKPSSDLYDYSYTWAEALGDSRIKSRQSYWGFNIGLMYRFKNKMGFYYGIGYTDQEEFYEYYDSFEILGNGGKYWVNGKEKGGGINKNYGIMIPLKFEDEFNTINFYYINIDFDTYPKQFSIGVNTFWG